MHPDVLGWAATAVLMATLIRQMVKQWQSSSRKPCQMAVRRPDDRICAVHGVQRDAGQRGLRGDQCDAAVDGGGGPGDGVAPPRPTPGSAALLIVNARCLKV